jgi:membrane peptidoglycan carboxypeptidase
MPVSFSPRRSYVEYEPPWYSKPKYYIPIAAVVTIVLAVGIYWLILAADLSRQAASYDLRELEKMESASVIVDRNDKIFGQIYVENRQTVPYSELPRDLVNAVVAMEDTKFYTHGGYDSSASSARRSKLHRGRREAGREHGDATARAQYVRAEGADFPPEAHRDLPRAAD